MQSDEDLALAVQNGNVDALARLVVRHHAQLIGFLYRMGGGDRRLAEDLAQEAFLRVLRGIDGYVYPRRFKPWLYAIAANVARDALKRAERRYAMVDVDAMEVAGGLPRPEEQVLVDEEVGQLLDALMVLPEHQRAAVVLRYYGEHSLQEIAEILAIPVGTVKSRLSLGIRALREVMKAKGEREKPKT